MKSTHARHRGEIIRVAPYTVQNTAARIELAHIEEPARADFDVRIGVMIQEYGAVVIDPGGNVAEMRGRQLGPRQSFKVRHVEYLAGVRARAISRRRCNRLAQTKTRYADQCRCSRE